MYNIVLQPVNGFWAPGRLPLPGSCQSLGFSLPSWPSIPITAPSQGTNTSLSAVLQKDRGVLIILCFKGLFNQSSWWLPPGCSHAHLLVLLVLSQNCSYLCNHLLLQCFGPVLPYPVPHQSHYSYFSENLHFYPDRSKQSSFQKLALLSPLLSPFGPFPSFAPSF